MKKSELISIIKLAVREELKSTLPSLLSEIGGETMTKQVSVENTERKVKQTKTPTRVFSRNEKINEALQATAGGVPQQQGSMVSGSMQNSEVQVDFNGNELNIEELPENLSNALTRDYTSLLTAIDKKKGNK